MYTRSRHLAPSLSACFMLAGAFVLLALLNLSPARSDAAPLAERRGAYASGSFTFGSTQILSTTILPIVDLEPEIKVDLFGNIYVTGIEGVPGGVDLWKSTDKGTTFTYLGTPDGAQCPTPPNCTNGFGLGGGDDSIDVSSGGYLYVSSLWLGSDTMSVSSNGGFIPWTVNPAASTLSPIDRQWIAAYGPQTVYNSYAQVQGLTQVQLYITKSTDAGRTFGPPVAITPLTSTVQSEVQGNLVVDKYNGYLYTSFVPLSNTVTSHAQIYNARSTDGGASWSLTKVLQGPPGTDNVQVFPVTAVDRGGNVHIAYSRCTLTSGAPGTAPNRSNCAIWLTSSTDYGMTWLPPVQVSSGPDTATAVMPWMVAGSPGVVDLTWYGTSATTPDVESNWHLFFAQTRNATSGSPTFSQVQVVPQIVHASSICFNGLDCQLPGPIGHPGNRNLAEYYSMTVDPDGNANIAFSDDVNNSSPGVATRTWYTRQSSGSTAFGTPAAPAAAGFAPNYKIDPLNPDNTPRKGVEPNIKVDSHNCIYIAAIGVNAGGAGPGVWKSENYGSSFTFRGQISNPPGPVYGGDADIITIPVSSTNPVSDTVYLSDLGISSIHISKSADGGVTFPAAPTPANEASFSSDRMWFAWDRTGASTTLYQEDHEFSTEIVRVLHSTNDGPWVQVSALTDPELTGSTVPNTNPGGIAVDRSRHLVYAVFGASTNETNAQNPPFGKLLNLWVASSGDGGITFTDHPVFRGLVDSPTTAPTRTVTYGTTVGNIFPTTSIDAAGNLYVVWAMNNGRTNHFDVWYAVSRDHGLNFYGPFQVNSDDGTHVFPWVAAGDAGRIDISWYRTTMNGDPNTMPGYGTPTAPAWNVYLAQSLNAGDREPGFTTSQASDHAMHNGAISTGGLIGSSDRSLADFFQVDIDQAGLAHIVYADTSGSTGASEISQLSYARQSSGASMVLSPRAPNCKVSSGAFFRTLLPEILMNAAP